MCITSSVTSSCCARRLTACLPCGARCRQNKEKCTSLLPSVCRRSTLSVDLSAVSAYCKNRIKKSVLLCYRLSAEDRRSASIFPRSLLIARAALTDYGYSRKFALLRKLQANIGACKNRWTHMFAVIHYRVQRYATLKEGGFLRCGGLRALPTDIMNENTEKRFRVGMTRNRHYLI